MKRFPWWPGCLLPSLCRGGGAAEIKVGSKWRVKCWGCRGKPLIKLNQISFKTQLTCYSRCFGSGSGCCCWQITLRINIMNSGLLLVMEYLYILLLISRFTSVKDLSYSSTAKWRRIWCLMYQLQFSEQFSALDQHISKILLLVFTDK